MKKLLTLISISTLLLGCTAIENYSSPEDLKKPGKEVVVADPIAGGEKTTVPDNTVPAIPEQVEPADPGASTQNPNKPISNVPSPVSEAPVKDGNISSPPIQGIVATYEPVPFTAAIYRTNGYFEDAEYEVVIPIHTKAELNDYIAKSRYDMSRFEADQYDEAFFKDHTLVLILLQENSGSITHEVNDVYINDGVMVFDIHRNFPEVGTADMAQYHVAISILKEHMITSRFAVMLSK